MADKDLLIQEKEKSLLAIKERVEQQSKELGVADCRESCFYHKLIILIVFSLLESLKQLDLKKEETLGKFKTLLLKSKKELTDTQNQVACV